MRFLVTGSARLDVYRRGGDSLQGRYHRDRLHPFSAGAALDASLGTPEPGAEVDFLVTVNREPWFAVEAKLPATRADSSLVSYKERLRIPFATR